MTTQPYARPPRAAAPRGLVTGASSGIGAAFAERLAQEGYDLILVARRREQLEALAHRLRDTVGVHVEVLAADLIQPTERQAVEERIARDERLTVLVNSAGFAAYHPFIELDLDHIEEQIQLHLVALTRLVRAALPGMRARGQGAIINLSSGLAFSAGLTIPTVPYRAVYGATKAFVNSFSQLLQDELAGTGIRVQALCPGPVRTAFHALAGMDMATFPPGVLMEPEAVVQASLAGLAADEVICVPALEDASLVIQAQAAQGQVLANMRRATLAQRYSRAD